MTHPNAPDPSHGKVRSDPITLDVTCFLCGVVLVTGGIPGLVTKAGSEHCRAAQ